MRALAMDRTNAIALLETAQLRFEAGDYANAERYYGTYRSVVRQQSARGLWLGIRLAQATGDRDAEGSYALALRNLQQAGAGVVADSLPELEWKETMNKGRAVFRAVALAQAGLDGKHR